MSQDEVKVVREFSEATDNVADIRSELQRDIFVSQDYHQCPQENIKIWGTTII